MKCIQCKTDFDGKIKGVKDCRLKLKDGAIIKYKGRVIICPKCGADYASEEDFSEMCKFFRDV